MNAYKLCDTGQRSLSDTSKTQSGDSCFFSLFPFLSYMGEMFDFSQSFLQPVKTDQMKTCNSK